MNSASSVGATDYVDWGQLGPDLTDVPGPFSAASNLSAALNVANGTLDFWSVQQGNSWGGNFTTGDNLLYDVNGGAVTIAFANPISAFGTQFQSLDNGPFTIFVTAFGAGNVNFGTVSATGTSNNLADGSAVFFGVQSNQLDILSLLVNVQWNGADDPFAINRTLFSTAGASNGSVPEPSSLMLAGMGLAAALWRMRRAAARR
ncbi:MAG: PEP-CTERM sorting domain-containing protein [Acidobacteria bacterium]|nr:PEP-CTERM sorting domain-containing protein [Acidobacteriota bacterium]